MPVEEAVAAEREAQEAHSALPRRFRNNRKFLAYVRRKMIKLHEKHTQEQEAEARDKDGSPEDEDVPDDDESKDSDDDPELAAARAQEEDVGAAVDLAHDALPSFDQVDRPDDELDGDWAEMSLEAKVSAAGPARAQDVALGGLAASSKIDMAGEEEEAAAYDWEGANVVPVRRAEQWDQL